MDRAGDTTSRTASKMGEIEPLACEHQQQQQWWRRHNIFGIQSTVGSPCGFAQRRELLQSNPVTYDAVVDFAAYVAKALPAAAPRLRNCDEERMKAFVELCGAVLEQLYSGPSDALRYAFRFVLFLRTRIFGFRESKERPRQKETLDVLIEEHSERLAPLDRAVHSTDAACATPKYWNYSWAAKELRQRCDSQIARPPCNCEHAAFILGFPFSPQQSPRKHGFRCPKRHYLELLHKFQVRAWGEVRHRVLLVAGQRLPVELLEKIFDMALEVEGVPENPEVFDRDWKPRLGDNNWYVVNA